MISIAKPQKHALAYATALAVVGGFFFLKFYFLLIALSAIAAFVFNPLYQRLLTRSHKPGKAAYLTLLAAILIVIIPMTLVVFLSIHQIAGIIDGVKDISQNVDVHKLAQDAVDYCNRLLASLNIPYKISLGTITQNLATALSNFGSTLLSGITSSISGIAGFFTVAILFIYVFTSMLIKQDKLIETVHQLNPLGKEISLLYTNRMASMTKAMVKGQFIIALAQGFVDALLLYLAGMHAGFFFYFMILTVLSIIPLGGGIIVIPIGIVMILTGHIWQGVLVLAGHFIIVTNIDNVLRPRLVPKAARLDPALTMLAVFSGLKLFGFLGIVLGPVVMIVLVTTIQVFMEVFRDIKSVDTSAPEKPTHKAAARLLFWRKPDEGKQ